MRQKKALRALCAPHGWAGWKGPLLLLAASMAHTLAFNRESIIWFVKGDVAQALALGALQTVMFWGLTLSLSLQTWLLGLVLPVTALISSVTGYFLSTFKIQVFGPNTVALAFETNPEEAAGFVSLELLLQSGIAAAVSILMAFLVARAQRGLSRRKRLLLIGCCLVASAVPHLLVKLPMGLPFDAVANTASYLAEREKLGKLLQARADLSLLPAEAPEGEMLVVLILGESARWDHFQINGYSRPTTPKVLQLGVLSLGEVTSCGTTTRTAVPCMLTRATFGEPEPGLRETSVVSVFRAAGFHTAWISNQSFLGKANTVVSAIAKEAHTVYFNHPQADNVLMRFTDQELLEPLDQVLGKNFAKAFIVLHTVGSHWLYDHHYPEEFRVFKPVCTRRSPTSCSPDEIINSYDNSILFTDHFISEVVKRVRHRRSLVWYVSDHGESLGEEGRWGHGQAEEIPEQRKVPMLLYASPAYLEAHGEIWRNLLAKRERSASHDNLFHSLIDCAGIRSQVVDNSLSLCADSPKK